MYYDGGFSGPGSDLDLWPLCRVKRGWVLSTRSGASSRRFEGWVLEALECSLTSQKKSLPGQNICRCLSVWPELPTCMVPGFTGQALKEERGRKRERRTHRQTYTPEAEEESCVTLFHSIGGNSTKVTQVQGGGSDSTSWCSGRILEQHVGVDMLGSFSDKTTQCTTGSF
jgi:hypothetical protein